MRDRGVCEIEVCVCLCVCVCVCVSVSLSLSLSLSLSAEGRREGGAEEHLAIEECVCQRVCVSGGTPGDREGAKMLLPSGRARDPCPSGMRHV